MYSFASSQLQTTPGNFQLDGMMMRYSLFVPRLYNFALSLGMQPGKITPSRAFCSDESQGYPIILLAKHFGGFPFNHGRVGGIVATDRHGPHASHGKDMVIVQASHVGYDPENATFGNYRRLQREDQCATANCGKIFHTIEWYLDEYHYAQDNIFLERNGDDFLITVDNQLLSAHRDEGLMLALKKLIAVANDDRFRFIRAQSTSKTFLASAEFITATGNAWPETKKPIGSLLTADLFHFERHFSRDIEGLSHLEGNLIDPMPWIVTSKEPMLLAAQINTQIEFDRTYRSIVKEHSYQNKNLLFVSGINIDISPREGQIFPLTKFVPWAAYIQKETGESYTLEQKELFEILAEQKIGNDQKIDLEEAIESMEHEKEVKIRF
ncbi:MAG TPA: hypothetical protein EYP51_11255 [Thiotrichales bacterium]|nr:hypothetical protein [Thiotrichales bacterium]